MKVFKEEQRFTQTWLVTLLGISLIVPIVILASEYFKEDTKISINEFVFSSLGIVICGVFIFFFKLKTRIDEIGIHYQFVPFHFSFKKITNEVPIKYEGRSYDQGKKITWKEITKAYVKSYNPISDFGGWGLKGGWSNSKGKAINVSGDIGIQLELKNGKKILIGTQKKEEATQVLLTYQNKLL